MADTSYTVRRMRHPEEESISQLFTLIYGDSYDLTDVYSPEKVRELDCAGQVLSYVALTDSGAVVGHYGVTKDAVMPVGEGGEAVVHPDHRGHKLLERMRACAEEDVKKQGYRGLIFAPVTVHPYSQHANEADGAKVCGIDLGVSPRTTTYAGIKDSPSTQRISMVLYFKWLAECTPWRLSIPDIDSVFATTILQHLEVPYEQVPGKVPAAFGDHSIVEDDAARFASARVAYCGANTSHWILQQQDRFMRQSNGETFFVDLPLSGWDLSSIVSDLRTRGFFSIGVIPEFHPDGPTLRYAYVTDRYDPAEMVIYSEFAKELLAAILAQRPSI